MRQICSNERILHARTQKIPFIVYSIIVPQAPKGRVQL